MMLKMFEKLGNPIWLIWRIVIGTTFLQHGLMKFGLMGGTLAATGSLMWFAGVIELVVGVFVTIGLFSRLAAVFGAIEMAYAYFIVHMANGFLPLANRGEAALLFLVSFLILAVWGGGKWSAEYAIFKKEFF